MPAGRYNFAIEKGSTLRKTLTWKDSVGNPIDLTGYTGKLQFRDRPGGTLYLELSTANGGISFPRPTTGQIIIWATPVQTLAIGAKKCVYDLELTAPTTDKTRLIAGKVDIIEEVTV